MRLEPSAARLLMEQLFSFAQLMQAAQKGITKAVPASVMGTGLRYASVFGLSTGRELVSTRFNNSFTRFLVNGDLT
jgi:hypothetical protein